MNKTELLQKLVLHWGEMGSRWGINRTVAQIHALLYFSPEPLTADEIMEALGVARSHVSNSLHELETWGIVKTVHRLGERRARYESIKDVWQMFEILLDERKRREMDPTLKVLRETAAQFEEGPHADAATRKKLGDMLEFFEMMDGWYGDIRRLPLEARVKLIKLGTRVRDWIK